VILSDGENIYPADVENVLNDHPAVDVVAVIGVVSNYLGQIVKAVFVEKNENLEPESIATFCKANLDTLQT
jgi:long-chain acyl-CoA synthetase